MANSVISKVLLAAALLPGLWAQGPEGQLDPRNSFRVNLPADGPIALVSPDWGQSRITVRGGAMQVDLRSTLLLKNTSPRRIRGVSLIVLAQEVTAGGKASVTVPSLDVASGEQFPIRVDLRLMKPLQPGGGALVEVGLDGVLFDDLTFFGPNRLNARRAMQAWELEARRDRKTMLSALESGGPEGLRKELLSALARQAEMPRGEMQVARTMPATNSEPGRSVDVAVLHMPDAPVELLAGTAHLSGTEARTPQIDVQNKSKRAIRYVELSWLVRGANGREYLAGNLPADVALQPGQRSTVRKDGALKFSQGVNGLTAFPAAVEFTDGSMWIPSANSLHDPRLASVLPATGEEQRLAELYRRKGLDAVIQQLRALR